MATSWIQPDHKETSHVAHHVAVQPSHANPGLLCSRQIKIKLETQDLASVRFAISPLWETVAAFRVWMNPRPPAPFVPWIDQATPYLQPTDWGLLADLALVVRGKIPDFLCPPPTKPMPTFEQELNTVMNVPGQVIRTEVARAYNGAVPKQLQHFLSTPAKFKLQIAALLREFWLKAISPQWSVLQMMLESEMLYRARALAMGGIEELLRGVHRDIDIRAGNLMVRTLSDWDGTRRKPGLLLIPSIFSWPDVFLTVRPPWRTALNYPCRGIADLWDHRPRVCSNSLEQLLGSSCAKIMAQLQVPRTTMQTAAALHLSPAATSEQISKLWSTGILERTRVGRRVFYSLNCKGTSLFGIFRG